MPKTKIFAEILKIVSCETEVSASDMISSCKQIEVVDARSIYVKILSEMGFYPVQIAVYMNRTASSIRYLISHYEERVKQNKMMAIYAQNVRKLLGNS